MILAFPIVRIVALLAGVHGIVRSAGEAKPAAGIHVELDGADRAVTDSAGRYTVAGLVNGPHQLRFISDGYEIRQLTVILADSSDLTLDVELTPRPVFLPPLAVVAQRSDGPAGTDPGASTDSHEAGHYRFAPGWQANQPAGSVDIQEALARVPGVATRGDNTTALSMHGGRGSENLTLLDGIPLYGAVHFAGASSAVNPDAIAAIDVHTGVSSARFGGALSGVVELETAEALSGVQVSGDLSTADVRSMVRAPLGTGGGVLLSARSSFRDLMTDATGSGGVNNYQDFLTAGRTAIGSGVLRVVGFESGNRFRWEPVVRNPAGVTGTSTATAVSALSDAADWQSSAVGATWTQPLGTGSEWYAAGWWTGNTATIVTLAPGQSERLTSGIGEFGLSTEWRQRVRASTLLFGGEVTRPQTWYGTSTSFTQASVGVTGVALAATPVLGAVYGEWDWHGASGIDFRAGLRGTTDFQRSVSLDPRVLVNVHPDLATRIELGFSRTHQAVQSMLNEENLMSGVIGPGLLTNTPNSMLPASADQWALSVERRIGTGVTVAVDGYSRTWRNVLAPAVTGASFFVTAAPAYGDGNANGVSASVSIVRDRLTVQAAAGVARSVQQAAGVSYTTGFERPWSFSGDVNYRLRSQTTLQFRWNTGAGQPATAVLSGIEWRPYQPATGTGEIEGTATNLGGAINALRLAGPLRVDVGVRREWHLGASDRPGGITTAVRLVNVFNQADPIGVMVGAGGTMQLLRGTPRGLVFEVGWAH